MRWDRVNFLQRAFKSFSPNLAEILVGEVNVDDFAVLILPTLSVRRSN